MSMISAQDNGTGQKSLNLILGELFSDLFGEGAPFHVDQGERLYKLYFFRPSWGRRERVEHRVLTKQRTNGTLEMISYTCWASPTGRLERSNVLRVSEMTIQALDRIISKILAHIHVAPDEFEEVDLTGLETLDEQLDYLKKHGPSATYRAKGESKGC